MQQTYRLVIRCPDRVGIVAKVSEFVSEHQGWLTEASYHSEASASADDPGWFFMRNEIRADSLSVSIGEFKQRFAALADEFKMSWFINDSSERKKVVILASHASHCLADILYRWHSGELYCDISAVIANHDNLRGMVEWHGIPFHHVPVDKADKTPHFTQVDALLQQYDADTIVLARYMQILPAAVCERYSGRVINIHHSFLPSFIGANPYYQAYDRGVKLIGATCHYVTQDLDQGPIIEQDVERISHRHNKDDLVRLGKDVEKIVLARGLRYHLEDRVVIHGNKTVIFD
ncbi:formyltetrahydrofolate deformylase [Ketobacter sp.]|uniref:formyltetrahydrofolate deformylase n=1 Tax=Ketobacter sp. TaxID=2083498 RepID=UPI000F11670F|nr:formyltetrahydrofolate deformylase [Ketobacter sp.]RLT94764.1 MAG: formyltetrahydrofolate deformylase [Ketobacter sp.]